MDIIEKKIKENYLSKADFSNEVGISPKDLSSKINTVQNRIDWLNEFLESLHLKVEIVETDVPSNGG
jgi:hypothetical protein